MKMKILNKALLNQVVPNIYNGKAQMCKGFIRTSTRKPVYYRDGPKPDTSKSISPQNFKHYF